MVSLVDVRYVILTIDVITNDQDLYNVYASPNYSDVYANAESTCRGDVQGSWVPPPEKTLAVDVFGQNGVVAERAWPASCRSTYLRHDDMRADDRFRPSFHT